MTTVRTATFVSTALPYVNAAPHLGFALELVIADALARARRLSGRDVCFVSGSDEHSLKNVLAAERAERTTAAFVAEKAAAFIELGRALDVSVDAFVRTSAASDHPALVHAVWRALEANGDLYKKRYRGAYCSGCEQFYEPAELPDGRCPEHDRPLEEVEEENWFFRLSRHREAIRVAIAQRRVVVEPESARSEALRFLEGDVHDLSVSRSAARSRGWGIVVPDDPTQIVYVWIDALLGYLTALGARRASHWEGAVERTHVIGKGITRFHAVYWLGILLAAGIELPTHILVHGYLTVNGTKISKSGASLDPLPFITRYGSDAVRYYLLRHVRTTRDGDFDEQRLVVAHDAELANGLGNLVSRVLSLIERHCDAVVPEHGARQVVDDELLDRAYDLEREIHARVDAFALDRALDILFAFVDETNAYVERTEPWRLARTDRERLDTVLHTLVEALFAIARGLAPFLPRSAEAIVRALGTTLDADAPRSGARTRRPPPLFPRLERREQAG